MESSANGSCKEGVKTEPDGLYENGDHTTPDIDEKYSIPSNKEDLIALYTEKYQAQKNGKTKGDFRCDICQQLFVFAWLLKRHIKTVHEGLRYSCDQCEFKATQQGTVNGHIQSIHKGIRYACDKCEYMSTREGNLNLHKKTKHGLHSLVSCNQCSYQTTYNSFLS